MVKKRFLKFDIRTVRRLLLWIVVVCLTISENQIIKEIKISLPDSLEKIGMQKEIVITE